MVPCIPAKRETSKKNRRKISRCQPNELSMCQNLPFSRISLPNPFMQVCMIYNDNICTLKKTPSVL